MNKTAIKNFAVWARNKLIADITYRAGLIGVSEKGVAQPLPQSSQDLQFFDIGTKDYTQVSGLEITQRDALVKAIREKERGSDYQTAFKSIVEEIAYTWFNRLIAIRFMEVNDYLPSRVRVLSSENPAKNEPDFVTTPFDTDLDFTQAEQDKVMEWKDQNKLDELFRMLFIKQCNKLHEILPELFEKTNDYTELLLNISFTDKEGVVYRLVHDIPEDDFNVEKEGQVEIIGWLYQYYNTELNEQVYDGNMSKSRITKELLPAATTIYTPDWAIQYMVQNSLCRLWVEHLQAQNEIMHPVDSPIHDRNNPASYLHADANIAEFKSNWKYYLEEAEQEEEVDFQLRIMRQSRLELRPEDIKVIDPCMGSGHILVYCFDVLMQIYESQGYTQRDAAQSILEHNLYGLDIDNRAAQMAYFAVMMKARQYDRRIFAREIKPHVYAIQESNGIKRSHLQYFGANLSPLEQNNAENQMNGLLDTLVDAKEYGSILNVENYDWDLLRRFVDSMDEAGQMTLDAIGIDQTQQELAALVEIGQTMAQKYEIVVTNPPYLGSSRFSPKLDKYVKDSYADVKSDLSMVMYKHAIDSMSVKNGYVAFITTSSWMFLSSFEKLRQYLQYKVNIVSLVDFGTELFDGKVGHNPIVAWVNCNRKLDYKMTAIRLVDYCYSRRDEKEPEFFEIRNRHIAQQSNFSKIPGAPIVYWLSEKAIRIFDDANLIGEVGQPKQGSTLGENAKFLRFWFEIKKNNPKWFKCMKGGEYRRWYGNQYHVLDWENDGARVKSTGRATIRSADLLFKEGITWSNITSGKSSFRYMPEGFFFESTGSVCFIKREYLHYLLAYLNSPVVEALNNAINPTIHLQSGDVAKLPLLIDKTSIENIEARTTQNIMISKEDWDSFETSWDFKKHPLL